jgi:hypothetical protein
MKRKRAFLTACGLGAVFAMSALATTAMTSAPRTDTSQETSHQDFYTDSQVDAAWAQAVRTFPNALPAGQAFPTTAPGFFHPEDGKAHSYHIDLPAQFVARYWRCAWLKLSLDPARADDGPGVGEIDSQLSAEQWEKIPEVARNMDVRGYIRDMETYAETVGKTEAAVEFASEC